LRLCRAKTFVANTPLADWPEVGQRQLLAELPDCIQNLPADLDRLGVDKDESDHTRLGAAIDPVVDRAALH